MLGEADGDCDELAVAVPLMLPLGDADGDEDALALRVAEGLLDAVLLPLLLLLGEAVSDAVSDTEELGLRLPEPVAEAVLLPVPLCREAQDALAQEVDEAIISSRSPMAEAK